MSAPSTGPQTGESAAAQRAADERSAAGAARRWLALGAVAGVALAAASLVRSGAPQRASGGPTAPPDTIVLVNDQPIPREALARFTTTIARERGRLDLDAAEQRRILSRLIDEELLFQHGIELGLERREPSARGAIVSAVVDSLTTAESREPSRAELEAFLRENPQGFTRPGRVTVEAARAADPTRAAEAARRARAGESLGTIAAELGEPIDPPLPAGPTSVDALRDRVGGIVVQAVANLRPGDTSDPVRAMDGYWVVHLVAREPDTVPQLTDVYGVVQQAWTQRDHEKQLEAALAALRSAAHIEILAPELR